MKHAGQRRPALGCVSWRTKNAASPSPETVCIQFHIIVLLPPSQILFFLSHTHARTCMHTHAAAGGRSWIHISSRSPLASQERSGRGEALLLREQGMRSRRGRGRGRISPLLQLLEPQPLFTAFGCLLLLGQRVTEGTGHWAGLRPTKSTSGTVGHAWDLPCYQECFSICLVSSPPPSLGRLFPPEVCSRGCQPG